MQTGCQAKQSLQPPQDTQSPGKQTARLTNFNSKSFCPSLLLTERVYLSDKPLLFKKKKIKGNSTTGKEISLPLLTSIHLLYAQAYLQRRPAGTHPRAQRRCRSLQTSSLSLSSSSTACPTHSTPALP